MIIHGRTMLTSPNQILFFSYCNEKLSVANFWGSFFSAFMSTWMGECFYKRQPKKDTTARENSSISNSSASVVSLIFFAIVPKDTGAYLASGNTASCTAQGFFDSFFFGLSVVMNSILAFTYCIIVKRGKRDEATRGSRRLVSVLYPTMFQR